MGLQLDGKTLREMAHGLYVIVFYVILFWRIFTKNRSNKLVECGIVTLSVFLGMIPVVLLKDVPDWAFVSWVILIVLLCSLTLFFLAQRGFRAFRRYRSNEPTP